MGAARVFGCQQLAQALLHRPPGFCKACWPRGSAHDPLNRPCAQTRYDTLSGSTLAVRRAEPNSTSLLVVSAGSAAAVDASERVPACGGSVIYGPTSTVLLPPLASRRRLLMRRSLA